jgi:hypothetical protein
MHAVDIRLLGQRLYALTTGARPKPHCLICCLLERPMVAAAAMGLWYEQEVRRRDRRGGRWPGARTLAGADDVLVVRAVQEDRMHIASKHVRWLARPQVPVDHVIVGDCDTT